MNIEHLDLKKYHFQKLPFIQQTHVKLCNWHPEISYDRALEVTILLCISFLVHSHVDVYIHITYMRAV